MTQPGEVCGRSPEVVAVAAAVAMLSDIWFVARVLWTRSFGIAFTGVSRDFLWMAPLSQLPIFILASLPLALIAPRLSLPLTRRLAVDE